MRTITFLTLFAAAVLPAVCARGEEKWKTIENESFSFSVPSSFKKTDASGVDSFVEEYVADGIKLSFDFGMYSNNFGDWPKETKFETLKIDGKAARIGTAKRQFEKSFPNWTQIHIKLNEMEALSMTMTCRSEKDVAIGRKVFESIAFKKKKD